MIDKGILETIEMLLNDVNGQRCMRLIVVDEIERDVRLVLEGSQMEVTIAGRVSNAYAKKGRATTTITLTARHSDGRIGIGVGTCDAHKPSVGRCWRVLRGMQHAWGPETRQKALDAWVERDADFVVGQDGAYWPEGPATLVERDLVRGESGSEIQILKDVRWGT